jgi:hypothetical protein
MKDKTAQEMDRSFDWLIWVERRASERWTGCLPGGRKARDWRKKTTNEREQRKEAAATKRASDGAFVASASGGGAEWFG